MEKKAEENLAQAYKQADALFQEERWEEAIWTLGEILGLYPEDFRAYLKRAIAYCQIEAWEKALLDLNRALEFLPSSLVEIKGMALQQRAKVHYALGNLEESLKDLFSSLDYLKDERVASTFLLMGEVYKRQGRLELAEEALRKFLEIKPEAQIATKLLVSILLRQGRVSEAVEELQKMKKEEGDGLDKAPLPQPQKPKA